jgi:hypothetical protein
MHAGKAASATMGRRKSSKEYFAAFKPISQSSKHQEAEAGAAADTVDATGNLDELSHTEKPSHRVRTLVTNSDSE